MTPLMLFLFACTSSAPEPEPEWVTGCPDAPCREAWILKRANDPDTLIRALKEIEQPEERIVLVKLLLDAQPGLPQSICTTLPPGDAQTYCRHLNSRPHLYEEPRQAPITNATRVGPANSELDCAASVPSAVDTLEAEQNACAQEPDPRSCYSVQATAQAEAGDLMRSAALCKSIEASQWRAECLFYSAEVGIKKHGAALYRDATDLCIAAAPFRQHCQSHILSALAYDTPAPTAPPEDWTTTIDDARRIQEAWAGRDDRMGALAVDRFWSEALHQSYRDADPVGNPYAHLPEAARPHIRAALTWRLVAQGPPRSWSGWVEAAQAALVQQGTHDPRAPLPARPSYPQERDLWGEDRHNDAEIPATFYLSTARRAHAEDPDEDLQICLLEALVRSPEGLNAQAALQSDLPLVKWTATRLSRF